MRSRTDFTYEENEPLLERGLIKLIKERKNIFEEETSIKNGHVRNVVQYIFAVFVFLRIERKIKTKRFSAHRKFCITVSSFAEGILSPTDARMHFFIRAVSEKKGKSDVESVETERKIVTCAAQPSRLSSFAQFLRMFCTLHIISFFF